MKLFLYSGGDFDVNESMDQELLTVLNSARPTITYVPAASSHAEEDFEIFTDYYSEYGIGDFHMLCIDQHFSRRDLHKALSSDVLYLGGGNTFHLMYHLRRSDFFNRLFDYVENGGVLVGESAGAIVLTGNIATASFPEFDRDDNDIGLVDWRGMDLVNFEFFPHFQNRPKYSRALRQYSRSQSAPILACCDGSGIVVIDDVVKFCGEVFMFCSGKKFTIGESF